MNGLFAESFSCLSVGDQIQIVQGNERRRGLL